LLQDFAGWALLVRRRRPILHNIPSVALGDTPVTLPHFVAGSFFLSK
jgi:hypothetical protein